VTPDAVPFSYYQRLTKTQKRIYDESDRIGSVELHRPAAHRDRVLALAAALAEGARPPTERAAQALADGLTEALSVPALRVRVQERRPSWQTGELHGLYEADAKGRYKISLWMRTAQRVQVVKFKTFLRTLLHELCHHLDYQRFRLKDSFHTEGFYRRESSLLRQLYPQELDKARAAKTPIPRRTRLRPPAADV
jgi:hypothetical protein